MYDQEYRVIRRAKNEWEDNYLDVSEALSLWRMGYGYLPELGN